MKGKRAIRHITHRLPTTERINNLQKNKHKTKEASLDIPERYGNSVWIVGGGPSLRGFDFSKLQGHDVIAVNKSIFSFTHVTAFVTMDYTFVDPGYRKCMPYSFDMVKRKTQNAIFVLNQSDENRIVYNNTSYIDTKYNYVYTELHKFDYIIPSKTVLDPHNGFGLTPDTFAHGNNSGFCAIQLAILMGYEKIYLLGFDLNPKDEYSHYHEGYGKFSKSLLDNIDSFGLSFKTALAKTKSKIYSCSKTSILNEYIPYCDLNSILKEDVTSQPIIDASLDHIMVVGFYTKGTLYETEAQKTIQSCDRWKLNYDIVGVEDFGGWQANTRYKAKFMREMLDKHPDKSLLYVDCDSIIQRRPSLFTKDYSADIAVRYQDFRWRKNECLSGTIYMENNERTRELCDVWYKTNVDDPDQVKNIEQWNLAKIIKSMKPQGLRVKNLPPEYTFIFDHMKRIYPQAQPVIEHFQASRKTRKKNP